MYFPKLLTPTQTRVNISKFAGYDLRDTAPAGTFRVMENLCSDGYPALRVRPRRAAVTTVAAPNGIIARDCLIWADGQHLYINGADSPLVLRNGDKQLVSMGAYLIIWPDKLYINTQDLSDHGSIENAVTSTGEAVFSLCRTDGEALSGYTVSDTAPAQPDEGALWLDTSEGEVLKEFQGGSFAAVEDICTRITAAGIGVGFAPGDGVSLTGSPMDGTYVIQSCDDGWVILSTGYMTPARQSEPITLRRSVPDMDFVIECGNRLWGCKYGMVDGHAVNEIYASALGDFKNWNAFAGLSTDSYAASRGSDGQFTGAVAHLGSPIFFKENCMERVYPSPAGAHQIVTVTCPGVKKGCHRSLAVVDGTLYYQGIDGIYAFDGSLPVPVSAALSGLTLSRGVAGSLEGKYVLSALDGGSQAHLLVYDTRRQLWHREDGLRCLGFAAADGDLFALTESGITALRGSTGTQETFVAWCMETGELGMNTPEDKYLQRLELRMQLGAASEAQLFVSYDGGVTWETQGEITGSAGRILPHLLHVRPKRCPGFWLKLTGRGDMRLYSVSAVYEKGSDEV